MVKLTLTLKNNLQYVMYALNLNSIMNTKNIVFQPNKDNKDIIYSI